MIESRNLFKLESKLRKDSKTIPVKTLEKDYVLSWLLIGIAKSRMCDILCFKGGTALKKIYFSDYRFSEDLDFTLIKTVSLENLEKMLKEVYTQVYDDANINIALKNKEEHTNGYTFYINFSGPLGADLSRGEIKTDFTKNEFLINKPVIKPILQEYKEYSDIPEGVNLKSYPLEEIYIEKYLSILDRSRNEPRDVYDLWYLISNKVVEYELLISDIKKKGASKGIESFNIIDTLERKEANYRRIWEQRLELQMISLPPFEQVYRELKRLLK